MSNSAPVFEQIAQRLNSILKTRTNIKTEEAWPFVKDLFVGLVIPNLATQSFNFNDLKYAIKFSGVPELSSFEISVGRAGGIRKKNTNPVIQPKIPENSPEDAKNTETNISISIPEVVANAAAKMAEKEVSIRDDGYVAPGSDEFTKIVNDVSDSYSSKKDSLLFVDPEKFVIDGSRWWPSWKPRGDEFKKELTITVNGLTHIMAKICNIANVQFLLEKVLEVQELSEQDKIKANIEFEGKYFYLPEDKLQILERFLLFFFALK